MPHPFLSRLAPLALIFGLTGPAAATPEYILPTLFDVAGVAADDVLNIRERPDATAPIIGTLAPDATGVEIVDERRGWGQVNVDERAGWVSMRYLTYRTDIWEYDRLPPNLRCIGTEPFWNIAVDGDRLIFNTPEERDVSHPIRAVRGAQGFRDPTRAIIADGVTLVAVPQICSDGMSDRVFGLRALVVGTDEPRLMSGCCSVAK